MTLAFALPGSIQRFHSLRNRRTSTRDGPQHLHDCNGKTLAFTFRGFAFEIRLVGRITFEIIADFITSEFTECKECLTAFHIS